MSLKYQISDCLPCNNVPIANGSNFIWLLQCTLKKRQKIFWITQIEHEINYLFTQTKNDIRIAACCIPACEINATHHTDLEQSHQILHLIISSIYLQLVFKFMIWRQQTKTIKDKQKEQQKELKKREKYGCLYLSTSPSLLLLLICFCWHGGANYAVL